MGPMGRLQRYLQIVMAVALLALCGAASASAAPSPAFATPGTFSCEAATAANRIAPPPPLWKLSEKLHLGKAPNAQEAATANAITPPCPAGQVPSSIAHGVATPDLTPTQASAATEQPGATSGQGATSDPQTMPPADGGENCQSGGCYWYSNNEVSKTAIGMEYETNISQPHVSGFSGAHSIDQLAIAGGGVNSEGSPHYTIEAGWDVDPTAGWGSPEKPHFFFFFFPHYFLGARSSVGVKEGGHQFFLPA